MKHLSIKKEKCCSFFEENSMQFELQSMVYFLAHKRGKKFAFSVSLLAAFLNSTSTNKSSCFKQKLGLAFIEIFPHAFFDSLT